MKHKTSKASRTVVSIAAMFLITSIALAIIGCGTNEEVPIRPDWYEGDLRHREFNAEWVEDAAQAMMEDTYISCFAVFVTVTRKDIERGYRYQGQEEYYDEIFDCYINARTHAFDIYQHWQELDWR